MRVSRHKGYLLYHEGDYSLEVFPDTAPYACLKHKCTASTRNDDCYDHVLPDELENMKCRYCDQLDIPEGLQALYYLFIWGTGQDE